MRTILSVLLYTVTFIFLGVVAIAYAFHLITIENAPKPRWNKKPRSKLSV